MSLPKITIVEGHKLQIAAFSSERTGKVGQKTIDLAPFAGQTVRIWLDADGTYSTEAGRNHMWQVAEIAVPAVRFEMVEAEDQENGEKVQTSVPVPLDLGACPVTLWPLPA